jgi:hypothetical protein
MKNIIALIMLFYAVFMTEIKAQTDKTALDTCDIIILLTGEEVLSKVQEISDEEVKYRKCQFLTGPIYTLKKKDVFMIKYPNGAKDVFKKTHESNLPTTKIRENENTEKPKSSQEENDVKVTVIYPGKKIIISNSTFDVYWDGVFIGSMSFKKGGTLVTYSKMGQHRLKVAHIFMNMQFAVTIDKKSDYTVELKYNTLIGQILIDKTY